MSQFHLLGPGLFRPFVMFVWQGILVSVAPRESSAVVFRGCGKVNIASNLRLSLGAVWK
jgi:hypothetical protein